MDKAPLRLHPRAPPTTRHITARPSTGLYTSHVPGGVNSLHVGGILGVVGDGFAIVGIFCERVQSRRLGAEEVVVGVRAIPHLKRAARIWFRVQGVSLVHGRL